MSGVITTHTKVAIVVLVLLAIGVGAGAPAVDSVTSLEQFQTDSPELDASNYIDANFTGEGETTLAQVIVRGDNVLSRESLVGMVDYQRQLRERAVINRTLHGDDPTFSVANAIAATAYRQQLQRDGVHGGEGASNGHVGAEATLENATSLSLERQQEVLETIDDDALEEAITATLGPSERTGQVLSLMPTDYEPGSTTADATIISVTQVAQVDAVVEEAAGPETIDAQLEMRVLGAEMTPDQYLVFGSGIIAHEIDASMFDSLTLVGPLALVFVLVALTIAYRDPLDILLGFLGIGTVLLMTFGFMGWTGVDFGQVFVAVPVLLIGLSIDYAIHIFMRYREHRGANGEQAGVREAMRIGLAGVGVALVFVTATTAVGFLSNVTSPVEPIQEFGIVSAAGIISALLVFGVLVPALKVELDERLEARGWDRSKRAFGTGGGRFSSLLAIGARSARTRPAVLLVVVLVLAGAGVVGGLQVDTTFDQEEFLADDPPEWTKELPGPFALDTYTVKSTLQFANDRFIRSDATTEILIRGPVTDPETLERVWTAESDLAEQDVTQRLPTGDPAIESPLGLMEVVAAENPEFAQRYENADTTGNGIPDRNIADLYDELFVVAPDRAGERIYRTAGGEYRALRLTVAVRGDADSQAVTDGMQRVAADISGDELTATATGSTILNTIIQDQLLDTVAESLGIALVVVFLFLMGAYRLTGGSASLGAVTLAPVAIAAAWIAGSMYVLSIPFNVVTGMILSLTIGLGVAYCIHISERYTLELRRQRSVWGAMHTAVTGTGGALLGSAATTVGGFGVLVFAILPPLRQFGLITALSIIYAFVGSILVLPTLLALWTRVAGPEWARRDAPTRRQRHIDIQLPAGLNVDRGRTTRTVTAESGTAILVDIELPSRRGKVVLRESVESVRGSVVTNHPEPVEVVTDETRLYTLWNLDDESARLRYRITVPDSGSVRFDGALLDARGSEPVRGVDRLLPDTEMPESGGKDRRLESAARQFSTAEIDHEEFEYEIRRWLSE